MHQPSRRGKYGLLLLIILLIYTALYVPTPFMVYEPGTAEEVGPIVKVGPAANGGTPAEHGGQPEGNGRSGEEGGGESGKRDGVFLLTTVRLSYANVLKYVQAALSSDAEIYRRSDLFPPGQTLEDYSRQQSFVMQTSQSSAIMAAYNAIGIEYEVRPAAVYVAGVFDGMPAEGVLQPGDRIERINGEDVRAINDLLAVVRARRVGDRAAVEYVRDGTLRQAELVLADMSKVNPDAEPGTPGIGISLAEYREIVPEDRSYEVRLTVENIGGPSAGLMFALEIYRQLTREPLAQGYRVAGTGEIRPDGTVGPIGGVQHKVVAAHRARAEVFLVPEVNYDDAIRKAEQMGIDMKIRAVRSLEEALDYLRSLPSREAGGAARQAA
jgi:PDZ domain-containing protein